MIPPKRCRSCSAALAETRPDADKYLDDLRRVAADFENYRKRTQREMAAMVGTSLRARRADSLLPVLDSFEAALAVEPKTETEEKLLVGVRNTYDLLLDVLVKEGLEPIETWDATVRSDSPRGGGHHRRRRGDDSRSPRISGAATSCTARCCGPPWWRLPRQTNRGTR